jgi:hypothetical protein
MAWGGRLVIVAGDDVDGSASTVFRLAGKRRPHANNRILVTVVTQGVVGLEKSRAAAGRERRRWAGRVVAAVGRVRALWICLARSRIWTAGITVFKETTGVSLTALCCNWISMGIIVNIGGKFWAARARFACWRWCVGQYHRQRWLVNLHRLCWELGPAGGQRLSFYFGCWRWRVGNHYFFEWNVLPWNIRAHKTAPKNHKNTNNSYLDI